MRGLLAVLVLSVLIAGCTGFGKNDDTTPTPTPSPSPSPTPMTPTPATPTPTPATPTPTPATPTPTPTPTPTTPTPTANETKRVNWTFNLTVGGADSPGGLPGSGTTNANCITIPSAHILTGMANATWAATATPLPGSQAAPMEIILQGPGDANARVAGPSPLSLTLPEISKDGESKIIVQHESPPALPSQTTVQLELWFDIPASDGAPGMPGSANACARVA